MENPSLYRKRIIPDECILLKDDEIIYINERIIVTSWKTLHQKNEFDHGYSCYFLQEGYKVSRFLRSDNTLVYWYCDIIDYQYNEEENSYIFRDLLADVIVMPDGFVKVVDLDEFEQALESESLTGMDVRRALRSLSKLLNIIYDGHFESLTREITMRI
ncbi:MAG: DUF402 domain-containing protein [Lachnospiraceae bacterium]|nr:DUF402 domain-containing protein [Lachnospiraceae bacterium]MCR5025198.1 DUF402 domain-containing protein [Lachnospiraceae bacterium]